MAPEDKALIWLIAIAAAVFAIYRFTGGAWPA